MHRRARTHTGSLAGAGLVCLLLAALFGFIIGWALRSMACQKKIAELEELQDTLLSGRET